MASGALNQAAEEPDFLGEWTKGQQAYRGALQQARQQGTAALDEQANALREHQSGHTPWFKMAAGFGRGSTSGHWASDISNGVDAFADADSDERKAATDRRLKVGQINAAKAKLGLDVAGDEYRLANEGLSAPGRAAEARDAYRTYNDDLSSMPRYNPAEDEAPAEGAPITSGQPPTQQVPTQAQPPVPQPPPQEPAQPAPVPPQEPPQNRIPLPGQPGAAPFDPSRFDMGRGDLLSRPGQPAIQAPGAPSAPGAPVGLMGQAPAPQSAQAQQRPPATPAEAPGPQMVAQAAPPQGGTVAPAAPEEAYASGREPLYQGPSRGMVSYAERIRQDALANPDLYSRNPRRKAALDSANRILQEAQQTDTRASQAEARERAANAAQERARLQGENLELRRKQASEDPVAKATQDIDKKQLEGYTQQAEEARQTKNALGAVKAARKNLWDGDSGMSTGKLGQVTTKALDLFGLGGGEALDAASGPVRAAILKAQNSGAISDTEQKMAVAQAPGVGMGRANAEYTIKIQEAIAERAEQMGEFMRTYYEKNRTLNGAREMWDSFTKQEPVFGVDQKTGETFFAPERARNWRRLFVEAPKQSAAPQGAPQGGQGTVPKYERGPDGKIKRVQ